MSTDGYTPTPHKKRSSGKKPYTIEWRSTPGVSSINWFKDWSIYKRYKEEKDRNKALKVLLNKDKPRWEYRKGA